MSENIGIRIQLIIPNESEIKTEINKIQNILDKNKLDLKFNMSDKALKDLEGLIKMAQTAGTKMGAIKPPKFDLDNPNKDAQSYLNRIESLVNGLKRFNGEVKYSYDALGKVNIQVQNAEGILKKYALQWDSTKNALKQVNRQDTNLTDVNYQKQLQYEQKLRTEIEKRNRAMKESIDSFKSSYLNVKIPGLQGLYKGHTDNAGIETLISRIKSLNASTPNAQRELKAINTEFQKLQMNARIAAKEMGMLNSHAINFGESFRTALIKFPVWLLSGTLILQPLQQLQKGIQYIYELDKALVDLKKVTNETEQSYASFAHEATEIGKSLARTSVEVVQATANFAKMGFQLNEAKELAKTAMVMQNVGDIKDTTMATQYLISTVKAYNIEAQDSIQILDILNNVSNKHSSTVAGLAEGLQRSASIMAQSGNSLEQTVALLTAANASIQHPERVANGFKTIALRLRGVDEEGGLVFPKLEGLMNKVGVKIRDANGEFLATYTILQQLSSVWPKLDSMTKSMITQQAAGVYQANVFESVLSNFSEAQQTLADGFNSANSAMNENAKYLESVEARYKQFQVRLEQLYETFLSSDLLKGFLTLGEGAIGVLTKVSSTLGGVTTAILALSPALLLVSTNFKTMAASATSGWATSLMSAITTLTTRFGVMSVSINTARIAMRGLQLATGLFVTFGIGVLVQGVFSLIDSLGKAKQEQDEYFKSLSTNIRTLSDDIGKINGLMKEYGNTKDRQRALEIEKELAQVLPQAVSGYNAEGQAIANNIPLIREMVKLKEEELKQKRSDLTAKFKVEGDSTLKDIQSQRRELVELEKERDRILQKYNKVKSSKPVFTEAHKGDALLGLEYELDNVIAKSNTLRTEILNNEQKFKDMSSATLASSEAFRELGEGAINQLVSNLMRLEGINIEQAMDQLSKSDFAKKLTDYNGELNKMIKNGKSQDDVNVKFNEGLIALSKTLEGITGSASTAREALEGLYAIPEAKNPVKSMAASIPDIQNFMNQLKPLGEEIAVYNQLLADSKEKQQLNAQEIMNLVEQYPDLLNAITIENGMVRLNTEAVDNLRNARLKSVDAVANAENGKLKILAESLKQELDIGDKIIAKLGDVAYARSLAFSRAKSSLGYSPSDQVLDSKDYAIIKKREAEYNASIAEYNDAKQKADAINKLKGTVKVGNYGVSGGSGSKKGGSKSPSSRTDKTAEQVQLEKYISLITKAKNEYAEMVKLIERKTNLGILSGLEIWNERVSNQEKLVNSLFDMPSELDKKLKDYQAQLGKFKAGTANYKAIQGLIAKVKADIKALPAEQEKEVAKLQKIKKNLIEIEHLTSKRTLALKIQLGLLNGFEAEEAAIELLRQKQASLFDQSNKINEQMVSNQAQIDALNKKAKDALAQRDKFAKGSADWNKWNNIYTNAVTDAKKLVNLNISLGNEQQSINITIQDTNTEINKFESSLDRIKKVTEDIQSNFESLASQINDIAKSSKDTFTDVSLRDKLNDMYGTDLFGTNEDFFNSIQSSMVDKLLGIEKFKVMLNETNKEAYQKLQDIINDPNATREQKEAMAAEIMKGEHGVKEALKAAGLSEQDLMNYFSGDFQAMVDLMQKQKDELFKLTEDMTNPESIAYLENELELLEDKVDAQEKLNQLKEKELRITELQAEIEKVKADKRFELITEQGERILTHDFAKVTDLEKQKLDAQNELAEYRYQLDVDNQRKAIQDKIDAQRKYVEEELPKLHADQMAQYTSNWLTQQTGEQANQTILTQLIASGTTDRMKSYDEEMVKLRELIDLRSQATSLTPANSTTPSILPQIVQSGKSLIGDIIGGIKKLPDIIKPYIPPSGVSASTNNVTNVNINGIKLDNEQSKTVLKALTGLPHLVNSFR